MANTKSTSLGAARGRRRRLPEGMQLRGNVYYAAFRSRGRLIRRKLSQDFDTAKEMLNELRSRLDRHSLGMIDSDCDLAELRKLFLADAKQRLRSWDEYDRDLRRIDGYHAAKKLTITSAKQIDHRYVLRYRTWRLAQDVTVRMANREIGTLKTMLNKAVAWRLIAENPIASVKPLEHIPTKERRALDIDEVQAILKQSPPQLKLMWQMYMTTGMRRKELVELRFEDIDFEAGTVTVRQREAKSKKARTIPLDRGILSELIRSREEACRRRPNGRTKPGTLSRDHVFVNGAGAPYRNNLLREFYKVCKAAGIDGAHRGGTVDIHALRVTFTTLALENGASPKAVQEILGHSTLDLTMRIYARATDRSKRDAISALPFASAKAPEHVVELRQERRA